MEYQFFIYSPWVSLIAEQKAAQYSTPYQFNGKEFDKETGLYNYGARYYDPSISVFMSADPLADKYPGWTPYHYVHNNPLRFIDPTGMKIVPAGDEEASALAEYRNAIDDKVNSFYKMADKKGWSQDKISSEAANNPYVQIQTELNDLEDSEEIFRIRMGDNISNPKGGGNLYYNVENKEFDVNLSNKGDFSNMQKLSHELTHAHQYLEGEIGFEFNRPNLSKPILLDLNDEFEAVARQNLFTSDPIKDVNKWVENNYFLPYDNLKVSNLSESQKQGYRDRIRVFNNIKLNNKDKSPPI